MAINKVGSKGIQDGAVATVDLAPGSVTNPKLTNSSFTFDGTSISLGGSDSVNLSVSWQSVVTADGSTGTTAVAGNGYFIDTTSAAHTLTLPASATIGDFIAIKDYAGTFNTNNLTIARNGHNIQGVANDSLITTNRASLVLVYVDATKGWLYWEEHNVADLQKILYVTATGGTVTESGDYKIHTFTGDGCFVVSCGGNPSGSDIVDYLVVAGGGGAGYQASSSPGPGAIYGGAGGGGAGGFRESHSTPVSGCYSASPLATPTGITVSATTYPITVGGGGTAGAHPGVAVGPYPDPSAGLPGSNSVFSTITSTGGGAGWGGYAGDGRPGGSGGGAAGKTDSPLRYAGGTGNTPPVSPPQGSNGGSGGPPGGPLFIPIYSGGGGGGATATGNPGEAGASGTGGNGATTLISGSPTTYAGGGGSNKGATLTGPIAGGSGGGGEGNCTGASGTANTGGGGGAGKAAPNNGASRTSGAGGKGIVIIRYKFQ
jgi:hypothetical protein